MNSSAPYQGGGGPPPGVGGAGDGPPGGGPPGGGPPAGAGGGRPTLDQILFMALGSSAQKITVSRSGNIPRFYSVPPRIGCGMARLTLTPVLVIRGCRSGRLVHGVHPDGHCSILRLLWLDR